MSKIKTKDIALGTIKTIDKSVVGLKKVKNITINTKNNVENTFSNDSVNSNDYATKNLENSSNKIFDKNINTITTKGKKSVINTKDNVFFIKNKTKDIKSKVKIKLRANKIKNEIKGFNKIFNNYTGLTKKQKNKVKSKKDR